MIKIDLIPLFKKFTKYISVGSLCSIFDYSTYSLFLFLGFNFKLAILFSETIGVFVNYHSQGKIVFKESGKKILLKYAAVYFLSFLINVSFLQILNYFNANMFLAEASIIPCLAVFSFLLNNKFVFNKI